MSSSNCCVLTCIQVSQEAGQVVWYSHLFQNFPQFIVIHAAPPPVPLDVAYFLKVAPVPHSCLYSIFVGGIYLEVEFLSPMIGSCSIVLRKAKLFSKVDLWGFRWCNNSCPSINSISQEGWLSNINSCSVFRFSIPYPWQIWVHILMIIISCSLVHNKTLPLKYILSFWHFCRSRFLPLV